MYYLAPPGKQPLKLVQGRQPALSPDGKKIAYLEARKGLGGCDGLMVLDLATGQTVTLLPPLPERIDGPSWSPGGDLLAFIYNFKEINLIQAPMAQAGKKSSPRRRHLTNHRSGPPTARACLSTTMATSFR